LNSYLAYTLMKAFVTAVAILVVAALLFPVVYVVLTSFSVVSVPVTSFEDLSKGLTLERYVKAVTDPEFYSALRNSVIVAALNVLFSVVLIVPAAYAFSRFDFRGKDALLSFYLVVSQAGGGFGVAAVIATYIFLLRLKALGIPLVSPPLNIVTLPLIYTASAVPFQTWLLKNYFDMLPRSLDEAAFIDGASWRDIVFKVVFPASRPAAIIVALFAFMGAWGEFLMADFMGVQTLAAYVYRTATGQTLFWADFAARTILFSIPIVALYGVSQRYIGEAMRAGARVA